MDCRLFNTSHYAPHRSSACATVSQVPDTTLIYLLNLSIYRAFQTPARGNLVAKYRQRRPPYATPAADLQHCPHGTHTQPHNLATYASDDAPSMYGATLRNSLLSDLAPPRPALMGRACEPGASNLSRKHRWGTSASLIDPRQQLPARHPQGPFLWRTP